MHWAYPYKKYPLIRLNGICLKLEHLQSRCDWKLAKFVNTPSSPAAHFLSGPQTAAEQHRVDYDGLLSPNGNSISVANTPGSLWRLTEPPYLATMPSTLRMPNPWSWPSFVVA